MRDAEQPSETEFHRKAPSKGDRINDLRRKEALLGIDIMMLKNEFSVIGEERYQLSLIPTMTDARKAHLTQRQHEVSKKILKKEREAGEIRRQIKALQGLKG